MPAGVLLAAVFFYPLWDILYRSFDETLSPDAGLWSNYGWFFGEQTNVTILRRTFVTAFAVTAICLLLAYPYAYLMTIASRRLLFVMLALVLLPFWSSLLVRNFAWVVLLQDNGPVNDALDALGLGRVSLVGHTSGVMIAMVQVLLPFAVLPLFAVLQGIDRQLLHAAESLGAPPWRAFAKVYLPLSLPGLLAGGLIVFVISLGFYITPALLGSPQNALVSQLIVLQVGQLSWGYAGAISGVLLVATLVLVGLAAMASARSRAHASQAEAR